MFDSTPDDLDMHVVYDVSHNIAKARAGSDYTTRFRKDMHFLWGHWGLVAVRPHTARPRRAG